MAKSDARFRTLLLPGSASADEVEDIFYNTVQETERKAHAYGNDTGGFDMATGIRFHNPIAGVSIFANAQAAEDYLRENTTVWKHALAVRYRKGDETRWMVGAWCAI